MHLSLVKQTQPKIGDAICLDAKGRDPCHYGQGEINWYTSTVVAVNGDKYQVEYDYENGKWYQFKEFDEPRLSRLGTGQLIWDAIPQ